MLISTESEEMAEEMKIGDAVFRILSRSARRVGGLPARGAEWSVI